VLSEKAFVSATVNQAEVFAAQVHRIAEKATVPLHFLIDQHPAFRL
jgi:hypothetical protein